MSQRSKHRTTMLAVLAALHSLDLLWDSLSICLIDFDIVDLHYSQIYIYTHISYRYINYLLL